MNKELADSVRAIVSPGQDSEASAPRRIAPIPARSNPPDAAPPPAVCGESRRPMDLHRYCECGDQFVITLKDQQFYYERQLKLPRHCEACRRARKQQRLRNDA